MQMGFVLEEIQMAPGARQAAVQRLRPFATGGTGMNRRAKLYPEVDPSSLLHKIHMIYLPGSDEAQGLGEQRFNHEEPVGKGKTAIVLFAEGGRLPSAKRKRRRGEGHVKGSATPGLHPPLTSPPPQPPRLSSISTRNGIEPKKTGDAPSACALNPVLPPTGKSKPGYAK